jgi:hypothetical protein
MLRISYSDTASVHRWNLYGRLSGPWVDQLRSCWHQARKRAPSTAAIVDLKDVTFIDEAGERLLAEMQTAGTKFIAAGVENKHLLASLRNKHNRPLRRSIECLSAPCGEPEGSRGGDQ